MSSKYVRESRSFIVNNIILQGDWFGRRKCLIGVYSMELLSIFVQGFASSWFMVFAAFCVGFSLGGKFKSIALLSKGYFSLFHNFKHCNNLKQLQWGTFQPIQGGGKKAPYQFFPVSSTNVESSFPDFWLLVWTIFPNWCKMLRSLLVPVLNYWTWTKCNPEIKVFLVKFL